MIWRSKIGLPFNNRRHLTILVATAEFGLMKEAANVFGTSQPVISRQSKAFEEALGVELFVRSNHGCIPTAKGLVAISPARRLLAEIDKAERKSASS